MNPIALVLMGLIGAFAIVWQCMIFYRIFELFFIADDDLNKLEKRKDSTFISLFAPPLFVGIVVLIGMMIYSGILTNEGKISWQDFGDNLDNALLFILVLFAKSIISPTVNALILCYSIYFLFEFGEFQILPIMKWIVSLLMENASSGYIFMYSLLFMFGSFIFGKFVFED